MTDMQVQTDQPDPKADLYEQVKRTHGYHRPNFQETMDAMGELRNLFENLGSNIVNKCPRSRELSLALSYLDIANMFAIAALARFEPEGTRFNQTSTDHQVALSNEQLGQVTEFLGLIESGDFYEDYDKATSLLGSVKEALKL